MTTRGVLLAALVIALDRLTKWGVSSSFDYGERQDVFPFFSLVLWHNEGAAFSVLATAGDWKRWFFVVLGVGFCTFLIYELRRLPRDDRVMWVVYGLILGGAIGNLIGRMFNGYVVDFLLFHYDDAYFPAFNIADSALFCGAVLWIFMMIREARAERQSSQS